MAVCKVVDDIILVAETDLTAMQATRHVANTLADERLASKIVGFVFNKVLHDPTEAARLGRAMFGGPYLGSIPFDLGAVRSFLIGELPEWRSPFSVHVAHVVRKAFPAVGYMPDLVGRPWQPGMFREAGLIDPDSTVGGVSAIFITVITLVTIGSVVLPAELLQVRPTTEFYVGAMVGIILMGIGGGVDMTRRVVGRTVRNIVQLPRVAREWWTRRQERGRSQDGLDGGL